MTLSFFFLPKFHDTRTPLLHPKLQRVTVFLLFVVLSINHFGQGGGYTANLALNYSGLCGLVSCLRVSIAVINTRTITIRGERRYFSLQHLCNNTPLLKEVRT